MKIGDKVSTQLGTGVIVECEGESGFLSHRYKIKFDKLIKSTYFGILHSEQGGLYFHEKNITVIKPAKSNNQFTLNY